MGTCQRPNRPTGEQRRSALSHQPASSRPDDNLDFKDIRAVNVMMGAEPFHTFHWQEHRYPLQVPPRVHEDGSQLGPEPRRSC